MEFQALRDPNMAKRLWEYNVIASCKFDRPIYSVVIFLKKDSVSTASPYIVCNHNGSEIHRFEFTVVKLWEVPTEMLFEQRFCGLLSLAEECRHVITSVEIVQQLVLKVGLAQSEAEARQHLLIALQS